MILSFCGPQVKPNCVLPLVCLFKAARYKL
jgi:hypothetical protein